MREILFRGKYSDTDWVTGDLIQEDNIPSIRENIHTEYSGLFNCYAVYPETIGEYTGLDDVHGNKVFEGDIVKVHDNMIGVEDGAEDFIGVVYYRDGSFMIITPYQLHYRWMDYTVEVIGNKFDNPEIWEEL